ncbi:adenosylcobinamide-GDP ribazoletransferase [Frankia sp. Cr2]|uniref:adenosylcobinamide-GDP ribazoletransferase n=1 Tax=Frankia sp. Cr2 TaxID=3073932 RepID=UPI002AD3EEBD|nr:adenosylcobinamide-GDP ribazoletransferase [Frankia sp. Cr2]
MPIRTIFSLLSILPVRGLVALDRRTIGRAMAIAPLVGLTLGVITALTVTILRIFITQPGQPVETLLPAAVGIATLAGLTRGLHLDGLADVADGFGAGQDRALAAMRDSRLGAFGVLALVFAVLVQVGALSLTISEHRGTVSIVVAAMTGRLAATLACVHAPAAHPTGLGALVARTVAPWQAACSGAAVVAVAALAGRFDVDGGDAGGALRAVTAVAVGTVAGWLLRRFLVRYLGGITGDVLGALVEVTATVTLVFMTLNIPPA